MRIILVSEQPADLKDLSTMLLSYRDIEVTTSWTNPLGALKKIKAKQANVVFISLNIGGRNGLELAKKILDKIKDPNIVFVAGEAKYAVEAFEINAVDYLLEPIMNKRLKITIDRLKRKISQRSDHDIGGTGLEIVSFENFKVYHGAETQLSWRTQKTKELFAYLWNGKSQSVSKSKIVDDVFPDHDLENAMALLHTTIYQIRKELRQLGYCNGITYNNDAYKLEVPIKSDVNVLDRILDRKEHNNRDIEKILEIYRGDFLGEDGYNWAAYPRQVYRDRVFHVLMDFARKELDTGRMTAILKNALDVIYWLEPFNGEVARMLIYYYGEMGRYSALRDFFMNYTKMLKKEMDLKPMERTINLYKSYMELT